MRKSRRKAKKNKIFTLILLLVLCLIVTYSLSKYIIQLSEIHIQRPKEFYFNSDILTTDNKNYQLTDWNGKDKYKIEIDLSNYEDILRYTKEEIKYNFSVTTESENVNITTTEDEGIMPTNSKTQLKETIYITPTKNFKNGEFVELQILAKSLYPYEKELKANIKLYANDTEIYEINLEDNENAEYSNLYISTKELENVIKISYDNTKVILDTNNELLQDIIISEKGTKSIITLTLEKNSNYNITFIKKDKTQKLQLNTDIIVE